MELTVPKRSLALLLAVTLAVAVIPGVAAAESRAGGNVVIGPDEVISEDLEAYGGTIVVHGTVEGDLRAFAGNVLVDGEVTGDVEAAAGSVYITGRVGGTVSASAGSVEIGPDATIGGDLEAAAGSITVNGAVDGSVRAAAEEITLGPTAAIGGDLAYDGHLRQLEGSSVGGSVRVTDEPAGGPPFVGDTPAVPPWVLGLYGFFANLLFGIVLLAAFPAFSDRVADRGLVNPVTTGGIGILTLLGVPVALVLIAVTVIGIPLAILGTLLFLGFLWAGGVYGRYVAGVWLLTLAEHEGRWAALLLGLVVVGVIARVPIIGEVVNLLVFLLGVGALARTLVGTYRGRSPGTATPVDEESGARPA